MATPSKLMISPSEMSIDYDFIIIGGGTAGLTIASRLSEIPSFTILVLEAGADKSTDPKILTPGLAGSMYDDPNYDWEFKTVPQKEVRGRKIFHPRGKVLGGSSAIYQLKIVFNSPKAWDTWATLGNPSWNVETMAPYQKKFQTTATPSPAVKELQGNYSHLNEIPDGENGPIQLSFGDDGSFNEVDTDFYKTMKVLMKEAGWNEKTMGGSASPNSIDPVTKTRSFAVTGYLGPEVMKRGNLHIITEAVVEKILFEEKQGEKPIVSGVKFSSAGNFFEANARKEVILCAGAFHSPSILELSGIGDADLLKKHGIEVILNNPNVGENLQDHSMPAISFEAADNVQTADIMMRDPSIMPSLIDLYEKNKAGPLAGSFRTCAYAPSTLFDPSSTDELNSILAKSTLDTKYKDHETALLDLYRSEDGVSCQYMLVKIQANIIGSETLSQILGRNESKPPPEGNFLTLMASQNHPFSKGNVHIVSSNPFEKPAVDPKYLSHPLDLEIMARHIQFMSRIISTPPLAQHFKVRGRRLPYGFENGSTPTIEEAKEIARDSLMSHLHPVGTCAMLPRDKGGVVDERLRVWGVKGLRVVDASVFPVSVRGNPITAVYAVAERAADLVKEDWGM